MIRLSKLPPKERQVVLTETSPSFTQIFRLILEKQREYEDRLTISAINKSKLIEIEVKRQEIWKREKASPEQEEFLYNSTRLFTKNSYLDSITVCRKFVENVGALMECIEVISAERSFWNPSASKEGGFHKNSRGMNGESNKKSQTFTIYNKFPHWFSASEGGTVYEWLCAFLEEVIVYKYFSLNFLDIILIASLNHIPFLKPL